MISIKVKRLNNSIPRTFIEARVAALVLGVVALVLPAPAVRQRLTPMPHGRDGGLPSAVCCDGGLPSAVALAAVQVGGGRRQVGGGVGTAGDGQLGLGN